MRTGGREFTVILEEDQVLPQSQPALIGVLFNLTYEIIIRYLEVIDGTNSFMLINVFSSMA